MRNKYKVKKSKSIRDNINQQIFNKIEEGLKNGLYLNISDNGRPLCVECNEIELTDEEILSENNICELCAIKLFG